MSPQQDTTTPQAGSSARSRLPWGLDAAIRHGNARPRCCYVTLTQPIPSLAAHDTFTQLREVRPLRNAARRAPSVAADAEPEQAERSAPPHGQQAAMAAAAPAAFDDAAAEERWREPSASDTPPEVLADGLHAVLESAAPLIVQRRKRTCAACLLPQLGAMTDL